MEHVIPGGVRLELENLPTDPDVLRTMLAQAAARIAEIESERDAARGEADRLRGIIKELQRHRLKTSSRPSPRPSWPKGVRPRE